MNLSEQAQWKIAAAEAAANLVEDGMVRGVPTDASPAMIAQILIAALEDHHVSGSAMLPTWDSAAAHLAQIYIDVVSAASTSHRS